jgi:hypothetical protein
LAAALAVAAVEEEEEEAGSRDGRWAGRVVVAAAGRAPRRTASG